MNEIRGFVLWADGREGLAAPLDPEALAASHPLWAAEVARFGPWVRTGPWWEAVGSGAGDVPVVVCGQCTSGLDVARCLSDEGALPCWGGVLAVSQTAGRGQLRRHWMSPLGNLYASWRWPALNRIWDPLAPLAAGGLVAEALAEWGSEVRIKWPNDLLSYDGRKVGGILVEERGGDLLVGIGLNLVSAPQDRDIRESWSPRAACLSPLGDTVSAILLWRGLVERARNWYDTEACSDDSLRFRTGLQRRLVWLGRRVRVRGARGEYLAIPVGLSEDGGLILNRSGREEILYSGSISPD